MLEHWLALFGAVLLSSVSQMLLKKSAGKEHKSVIFEYLNPWVISGYFLLAASTICVIFSPSTNDCSVVSTCGAGTPYCAAAA